MYLWLLYHSTAEHMPTSFKHGLGKPLDLNETPFPENRGEDDQVLRHVNAFMQNLHVFNSDVDLHLIGPGTFRGERRFLQHGSRIELYFEYLAHVKSQGKEGASLTTFLRITNKILGEHGKSRHLHFRKPNEHSHCDTCARLKKALRQKKKVVTADDDDPTVRAYSTHILSQWLDRQIYWSFRTLSQTWFKQQRELGDRMPALKLVKRLYL